MNWLVIAVIVLIVLATLAGAKRGLVKTVLSFASFFVSLVIMLFVREPVSDFVKRFLSTKAGAWKTPKGHLIH